MSKLNAGTPRDELTIDSECLTVTQRTQGLTLGECVLRALVWVRCATSQGFEEPRDAVFFTFAVHHRHHHCYDYGATVLVVSSRDRQSVPNRLIE